jgi:hypothetical protein
MTPEIVEDRLEEAWRTCKHLLVARLRPAGYGSAMPDPIRDPWEASMEPLPPHILRIMDQAGVDRELSGTDLVKRLRSLGVPDGIAASAGRYKSAPYVRPQVSSLAIDRMDECFGWVELAGDSAEVGRLVASGHTLNWAEERCYQRRRVLWWRAAGCSWRAVGRVEASFSPRCSERHVRTMHDEGLSRILARL